jgi:4-carboxymuconolactone decarboxylase
LGRSRKNCDSAATIGLAKIRRDATLSVGWDATNGARQISPAFDRAKFRENTMKSILRASLVSVVFAGSAVALTGERMAPISLDKMSPAQRKVAEDIMSGPRGGLRGPFNAWLRSPELADRLQKVGEYLRFNTSLDKRVNEMAIIMTAQAWGSQYEWYAHAPLAKAGLDPSIVEGDRRRPQAGADEG